MLDWKLKFSPNILDLVEYMYTEASHQITPRGMMESNFFPILYRKKLSKQIYSYPYDDKSKSRKMSGMDEWNTKCMVDGNPLCDNIKDILAVSYDFSKQQENSILVWVEASVCHKMYFHVRKSVYLKKNYNRFFFLHFNGCQSRIKLWNNSNRLF